MGNIHRTETLAEGRGFCKISLRLGVYSIHICVQLSSCTLEHTYTYTAASELGLFRKCLQLWKFKGRRKVLTLFGHVLATLVSQTTCLLRLLFAAPSDDRKKQFLLYVDVHEFIYTILYVCISLLIFIGWRWQSLYMVLEGEGFRVFGASQPAVSGGWLWRMICLDLNGGRQI